MYVLSSNPGLCMDGSPLGRKRAVRLNAESGNDLFAVSGILVCVVYGHICTVTIVSKRAFFWPELSDKVGA